MSTWKCKVLLSLFLVGLLVGSGCSRQQNVDSEEYLRCNKTSNGVMTEIESGYFRAFNNIIYYADKTNLELWVPVCNKPDCIHSTVKPITSEDQRCNGYTITNQTMQKNGKIYETERVALSQKTLGIIEIATDGSGAKRVYEIPWEEESLPDGRSYALYQDCVFLSVDYLNEKGYDKSKLIRVQEDENGEVVVDTLYDDKQLSIKSGNVWWGIRGDKLLITNIDWDKDSGQELWRNLWRIEGTELIKLNIPEEIDLLYSYLSGNELTYYEQNEGFYKLNLDTGEKQLIVESQLKESRGYVFSEELMFEYNCYTDHTPEDAMCMKMYNGKEWKDIQLPEEITNQKRICSPSAWASDRIFFTCLTGKKFTMDMYYMMLDEKNPQMVYAGQISDKPWEEEYDYENNNTDQEDSTDFEEMTIFDNEDGVLKVTGARQNGSKYEVDLFFEVGESGREYDVTIEALINGIQCHTNQSLDTIYPREGTVKITFGKDTLKEYGVTDIYSVEEFTDIELTFYVNEMKGLVCGEEILKKSVHIYPKGEEATIHYKREPQETDLVVIDNEKVRVTFIDYAKTKVENDTPIFFIENKTDQDIQFNVQAGSMNGYQDNTVSSGACENIQAGACAFRKIIFGLEGVRFGAIKNFWEEHQITEVGKMKILMDIGYIDIGKSERIGEPFIEEIITLYPQGEENSRDDGIKPQETDVVLIDNEYIKMILIGYQDYESYQYTDDGINRTVIANGYAKIVVKNKTDEVLYSQILVQGDNGIIYNNIDFKYTLLPGENYLQVAGNVLERMYPEGQQPVISKIEFLYQVLDKEKHTLCQEYIDLYPQEKENVTLYKADMEDMKEVLVDQDLFTIAVYAYENGDYDEKNPYPNCRMEFAFINKTDQMICLEIEDILINGEVEYTIEENEGEMDTIIAYPQAISFADMNMYEAVKSAGMTELEDVEMTFKVYVYNYKDGSLGEELGNTTVKFGPK